MKENLKTLSLVVIAISVFAIAVIDVLKLTMPRADDEFDLPEIKSNEIGEKKPVMNHSDLPMDTSKMTSVKFEETEHDFGTIQEGDSVSYPFKFVNTGYHPLVITSAIGSCGCTVPDYPKGPIPPGKSSIVIVKFRSEGKGGKNMKTVQVVANTNPRINVLTIKADVHKRN